MNPPPTENDLRSTIVTAIIATAPDVADDISAIGDDADLFDEFGLDSMDRMNIMTALSESTGVAIPDEQYSRLNTIDDLIGQLS